MINSYFIKVENLDVENFVTCDYSYVPELNYISKVIENFKNHPSILKIKENVKSEEVFYFSPVDESIINDKIDSLDKKSQLLTITYPPEY